MLGYLNDAAAPRCCLHGLQQDGVCVLAAHSTAGEDDTASPAAGHSRRDEIRCSVVSTAITLRHVGGPKEKAQFATSGLGRISEIYGIR